MRFFNKIMFIPVSSFIFFFFDLMKSILVFINFFFDLSELNSRKFAKPANSFRFTLSLRL